RQISSGQHENDVLKVAHEIFFADQGSKFTLEHAWCVLRYEQKWLNLNSTKASESSKRKTVESDSKLQPQVLVKKRYALKFSDYTWVLITAIHNLHRMRRLVGLSQTVTTTKSNLSFSKTKLS
uniref:No apical meristem-associated C-terminal domain-containing protein n=1 Tax=Brassica oleracea var. oleracea TaxID=109376 RepID=A0A0D2ZWZ0_BRAOL